MLECVKGYSNFLREDSLFMCRGGQTFFVEILGGQTVFGGNFGSGRTFSHEKCTITT